MNNKLDRKDWIFIEKENEVLCYHGISYRLFKTTNELACILKKLLKNESLSDVELGLITGLPFFEQDSEFTIHATVEHPDLIEQPSTSFSDHQIENYFPGGIDKILFHAT